MRVKTFNISLLPVLASLDSILSCLTVPLHCIKSLSTYVCVLDSSLGAKGSCCSSRHQILLLDLPVIISTAFASVKLLELLK